MTTTVRWGQCPYCKGPERDMTEAPGIGLDLSCTLHFVCNHCEHEYSEEYSMRYEGTHFTQPPQKKECWNCNEQIPSGSRICPNCEIDLDTGFQPIP